MTEGITKSTTLENSIIESYFDKNDELVGIKKYFKEPIPGKPKQFKKGQILSEITFKDNGRTPEKQIQYEYNTNKELIKIITTSNNIVTTDDIKNNIITTETYYPNGKIKERIIKNKKNNNIISMENFNENGICTSATACDTKGQIASKKEFYEDGEKVKCLHSYENSKRIKSESFDEENNKTQEDTYYSFNDTKIQKSTIYDPQTGIIEEDLYFDSLGKKDKRIRYTYTETTAQLDTYNSNGKKIKTEIFDKENNKIEEQIPDDEERVIQITKFHPNKEKDLEIFFDKDGKIEGLKTYYGGVCNREYTFQNIVNFDRDKFLNFSIEEQYTLLDKLIETNTKYYAEYDDNREKTTEIFYKTDGTVEKMIRYKNGKKDVETIYRGDGRTIEKMIKYENGKKDVETIYRGDGRTREKMIFYENDEKTINKIAFCDANNEIIDIIDGTKLQELLKYLNTNDFDIETLTISIDEKDSSITYYTIYDKTDKNMKKEIIYKDKKRYAELFYQKDGKSLEKVKYFGDIYSNQFMPDEFVLKEDNKLTKEDIINSKSSYLQILMDNCIKYVCHKDGNNEYEIQIKPTTEIKDDKEITKYYKIQNSPNSYRIFKTEKNINNKKTTMIQLEKDNGNYILGEKIVEKTSYNEGEKCKKATIYNESNTDKIKMNRIAQKYTQLATELDDAFNIQPQTPVNSK